MWPACVYNAVRDGGVEHHYLPMPYPESLSLAAYESKLLLDDGCSRELAAALRATVHRTPVPPESVYVTKALQVRTASKGQRFFAQLRAHDVACEVNAVMRLLVESVRQVCLAAIILDKQELRKKVSAVRRAGTCVKSANDCPVRLIDLHSYFTRGNFLPFLHQCEIRDENNDLPQLFVDVSPNISVDALLKAHSKNLVRVVAMCRCAHLRHRCLSLTDRLSAGGAREEFPLLAPTVRQHGMHVVSHGAICVALERILRAEVVFWQTCAEGNIDKAFECLADKDVGRLWHACFGSTKGQRPWRYLYGRSRQAALRKLKQKPWQSIAVKKIRENKLLHPSHWKVVQKRPTATCSSRSLNYAQIGDAGTRLAPTKQVMFPSRSVLITDNPGAYSVDELRCFARVLNCSNTPWAERVPMLHVGVKSIGKAAQWCLGAASAASLDRVKLVPAPSFARKCIQALIDYCAEKVWDEQKKLQLLSEKDKPMKWQVKKCEASLRAWKLREAQHKALLQWRCPLNMWGECALAKGDEVVIVHTADKQTHGQSGIYVKVDWTATHSLREANPPIKRQKIN